MEGHVIEFLWNFAFFILRESKARKPRPVGLDDSIDRGIVLDATCFSISRDIRVFERLRNEMDPDSAF